MKYEKENKNQKNTLLQLISKLLSLNCCTFN